MSGDATRTWSTWPLIAFLVGAVVEALHLLLFPLSGGTDAAMELGVLAAATLGGALALRSGGRAHDLDVALLVEDVGEDVADHPRVVDDEYPDLVAHLNSSAPPSMVPWKSRAP